MQQVYPWEEAEPQGLLPGTGLRPYQKQSLAFMLALEAPEQEEEQEEQEAPPQRRGRLARAVRLLALLRQRRMSSSLQRAQLLRLSV